MIDWIVPKTDWSGESVNGIYVGDYFNIEDYNRIKNNLLYLCDRAKTFFYIPDFINMEEKTYKDFPYPKDINAFEKNLEILNVNSLNYSIGTTKTFMSNGNMIDYIELNRIENALLLLYNGYNNQISSGRHFTFNFEKAGMLL